MTIAYVVRYWPTMSETFIAREIRAVRARGIPVEVVALGRRADPRPGELVEVPVHRPPGGLRLLRHPPRGPWRGHPKHAMRVSWLTRLARRRGFRRFHAHFAGEAARLAADAAAVGGRPYSVTTHAVDLFKPRADLGDLLHAADVVVTVCEHHRQWIDQRFGRAAVVVRCGVDCKAYPEARPAHGRYPWVCVARDVAKKGLADLVEARRHVGGQLRLVSDGVRFGGPGVLAGPLAAAEVPRALSLAEAFVLPCRVTSDGDRDGVPVALMEAMAAGLPVVTTRVAGIPELVDASVGWLVAPDDRPGLVDVMREVRADAEARVKRGRAARQRIRDAGWTVERQARELIEAWR